MDVTLPLALLALYQKFTCLSFAERVTEQHNDNGKKLLALQRDMLEFKAYGTVPIASISRWGNVQEIYRKHVGIECTFYEVSPGGGPARIW